ncbi:hypothetical protein Tco_1088810 [Tanacetum coccineum]
MKVKSLLNEESGEAMKKQGRTKRGPLIARASSSLNVEKLDDATTQTMDESMGHTDLWKSDDDREDLMAAANYSKNVSYLRMSESKESVCGESRLKDKKVNIDVHGNAGKNVGPSVAI